MAKTTKTAIANNEAVAVENVPEENDLTPAQSFLKNALGRLNRAESAIRVAGNIANSDHCTKGQRAYMLTRLTTAFEVARAKLAGTPVPVEDNPFASC